MTRNIQWVAISNGNLDRPKYHTDPDCTHRPDNEHLILRYVAEEMGYSECAYCAGTTGLTAAHHAAQTHNEIEPPTLED